METRTIVMKVQYGEILRRLNAKVVDLSMGVLTEKISTLFKFGTDAEIMLSFTDEDGDSVVLVDDEDLTEMVKQQQSPLRINVKSNGKAIFFLPPNPGRFVETYNDCSGTTYEPHSIALEDYYLSQFKVDRRAMPDDNYPYYKHATWTSQASQVQPKLDSYLICRGCRQYNILLPPSSPFTKIWTMRNTGMVSWPQKTRLVWIEGYKMTNFLSVELEIPATGVPVGQEFDVSVDFVSPEHTGPYVSYWRMISPSGEKFGERIWVLIQVTQPVKILSEQEERELLHQTGSRLNKKIFKNKQRMIFVTFPIHLSRLLILLVWCLFRCSGRGFHDS